MLKLYRRRRSGRLRIAIKALDAGQRLTRLETRDDRLRGSHTLGHLFLGQPRFDTCSNQSPRKRKFRGHRVVSALNFGVGKPLTL